MRWSSDGGVALCIQCAILQFLVCDVAPITNMELANLALPSPVWLSSTQTGRTHESDPLF
jgi:hypothetical protein